MRRMTDLGDHLATQSTPAVRPGEISILLGTRGRPEMLAEAYDGRAGTHVRKESVLA